MDVELKPKSNTWTFVPVAPIRRFPLAVAPLDAGSAAGVTTSNLITGEVVPIPVCAHEDPDRIVKNAMNSMIFLFMSMIRIRL